MIVLQVFSGMASRCQTLAEVYHLGKKCGKSVLLVWEKEEGCNIDYYKLFDISQFSDIKFCVLQLDAYTDQNTGWKDKFQQGEIKEGFRRLYKWIIRKIKGGVQTLLKIWFHINGKLCDYQPRESLQWKTMEDRWTVYEAMESFLYTLNRSRD